MSRLTLTQFSLGIGLVCVGYCTPAMAQVGAEKSVPRHLQDGEEFQMPLNLLLDHGRLLFAANWTRSEGAGRPLSKGTGPALSDPSRRLDFPFNFNRISGPDANSCAGCHNSPLTGGNGDFVANVFVLGQRFDFATLDHSDPTPLRGGKDESGKNPTLQQIANSRSTPGMFGAGYIEMLAREMTTDLRALRDGLLPGASVPLVTKGVSFGTLARTETGDWDCTQVQGLPRQSVSSNGTKPNLLIRPFHQASNVVSLRQFSNNAYNHHHGIQTTERFGDDADTDGDGHANEMTRADVTAVSLFQAAMAVPGRVISRATATQDAVLAGEQAFMQVGCATCHVPALPLTPQGVIFTEPGPFNPPGNETSDSYTVYSMNLNTELGLPQPRLNAGTDGTTHVPAFTDLKLHDITSGPNDPNREVLDQNASATTADFFAGNGKFITRKLWGVASKPNYFHHGLYTTMHDAIMAHHGEAAQSQAAYAALSAAQQAGIIEFLKSLRNLPDGSPSTVLDDRQVAREWPPHHITSATAGTGEGVGQISLAWQGGTAISPTTRRYQVQKSTDLINWINVGTETVETSVNLPAQGSATFYRVLTNSGLATEVFGHVPLQVPAQSEASLAPPLLRRAEFGGSIVTAQGNTITVAESPAWAASRWVPGLSQPETYALIVTTGPKEGLVGMVTASGPDTLTLALDPAEDLSGLRTQLTHGSGADQFVLVPYWTPRTLFTSAPAAGTKLLIYRSTAAGVRLAASKTLEHDGSQWLDTSTFQPADDFAIGYHEAFIVRNPSTSALTSMIIGQAPLFGSRMILRTRQSGKDQDIRFGYLSPVAEPFSAASLGIGIGDELHIYNNAAPGMNKAASRIFEWDGTQWLNTTTFQPATLTDVLEPCQGYLLRKKATAQPQSFIWADRPSYLPQE